MTAYDLHLTLDMIEARTTYAKTVLWRHEGIAVHLPEGCLYRIESNDHSYVRLNPGNDLEIILPRQIGVIELVLEKIGEVARKLHRVRIRIGCPFTGLLEPSKEPEILPADFFVHERVNHVDEFMQVFEEPGLPTGPRWVSLYGPLCSGKSTFLRFLKTSALLRHYLWIEFDYYDFAKKTKKLGAFRKYVDDTILDSVHQYLQDSLTYIYPLPKRQYPVPVYGGGRWRSHIFLREELKRLEFHRVASERHLEIIFQVDELDRICFHSSSRKVEEAISEFVDNIQPMIFDDLQIPSTLISVDWMQIDRRFPELCTGRSVFRLPFSRFELKDVKARAENIFGGQQSPIWQRLASSDAVTDISNYVFHKSGGNPLLLNLWLSHVLQDILDKGFERGAPKWSLRDRDRGIQLRARGALRWACGHIERQKISVERKKVSGTVRRELSGERLTPEENVWYERIKRADPTPILVPQDESILGLSYKGLILLEPNGAALAYPLACLRP